MSNLKLSIIIPVFNGEQFIESCLTSIFQVSIPVSFEVLVIDDGSTDHTWVIANKFACKCKKIEKSGVASARNVGIAEASGEVLLFFDADTLLTDNTVSAFLEVFNSEEDVFIAQGKWAQDFPSANFNTTFHLNKWSYNFQKLLAGRKRVAVAELMTGCLGVRKEVFEKIGGFNENYKRSGGEEWELGFRAVQYGYKIYYYDSISVHHNFGSFLSTVKKTYFRTINFAMLIFDAGNQKYELLNKIKNSVPNRDKYNMVFVSLVVVMLFLGLTSVGSTLSFFKGYHAHSFVLLSLFFLCLYLYNVKGFLYYQYGREGVLFTLRGLSADFMIVAQKVLATLSALFIYYVLRKPKFKI
ncbi:MAG: glycosyltransferase [Bacteroidetes bacterium]|nr:glycosyltransferase [Bacteroidota bacterium]